MSRHIPPFIVAICVFAPFGMLGQKISGHVLNEGGKPASYVTVRFNKLNSVFTNPDGSFVITAGKLPDTLFFFAPGFEPYKVLVTEETAKDDQFEVVLLNTRRKIKSSEIGTGVPAANNLNSPHVSQAQNNGSVNSNNPIAAPGSYIAGKKLLWIDTSSMNNSSMVYRSGLLTAGEVNDFDRWKMWQDFSESDYKACTGHWGLYPQKRYAVQVQNKNHDALINKPVFLIDKKTRDTVWSAVTDNTGKAELWAGMSDIKQDSDFIIAGGDELIQSPLIFANGLNTIQIDAPCTLPSAVDIAMVVDATGSMSGEIDFLKIELEDVIRNTFAAYRDLDLQVGSVFYRDRGDEYLTRHVGFQNDLLKVLNFIKLQRASGGGDVPEAVDAALQTALDSLHWRNEARARILFLITDAPPHDEAKEKIFRLIEKAASKGVRIVPVICSGADKSTEFIMRTMAVSTNGTYVFLTNDNNAGFIESAQGTDAFYVQFLNTMLERIINEMVFSGGCGQQSDAGIPATVPGNIGGVTISAGSARGIITIHSSTTLKDVFITDFTGKILVHVNAGAKPNVWTADVSNFPGETLLVKYITTNDKWGAEKIPVSH